MQNEFVDVNVDAEIVADGSGGTGGLPALTKFDWGTVSPLKYTVDRHSRKIVKVDSKLTWRHTITIQTSYAPGVGPNSLSGYGRGTTPGNVGSRDITLGFHEDHHRRDYETYLKANPLPDPPQLKLGITEAECRKAIAAYEKKLKSYSEAMTAKSVANTDEVGHKKSTFKKTGKAFVHVLPPK